MVKTDIPNEPMKNKEKNIKKANEKPGKQTSMTYRETLLGIDNSEPSSDF